MKKLWLWTIILVVVSSVLMAGDEFHLNYIFGPEPAEGYTEGDDWYYEPNDEPDCGEIPYLWINNPVFGSYLCEIPRIGLIFGYDSVVLGQKQFKYDTYPNVGGLSGYVTGEITGYNTGTVFPDSLLFNNNCFNCNGGGIYPEKPGFFEEQYFQGGQIYNNLPFGAFIPFF